MNEWMVMNMRANEEHQEPKWRYDVFMSFRSETRYSFAGNLCNALRLRRIKTCMDDGLKSGDQISSVLLKSLQESRICIVILSKHYADSRFCLDELAKTMECSKTMGQLVAPIFYDVEPSHVRYQTCDYGTAMCNHEIVFGNDSERVKTWRTSLYQISNIAGWDFKRCKHEYEFIQNIVDWVMERVPRYDVFLSFGQDTRYSFTGFLYDALRREGFQAFMNIDDDELKDGAQISESIVEAIEKSRISIIVFSENYASSASSLDELVKILECMKKKNQLVWPIFYKVEPSDLRHLRNSYGKGMINMENTFGKDSEKVHKWKLALSKVANLKGWHLKIGYEYEFIERIVEAAIKI